MLIEIKTGVAAADIYEAVGQLKLYPSLVDLPKGLEPVLLIPGRPTLRPQMAAALSAIGISVFYYDAGMVGKKPKVSFPARFLKCCRGSRKSSKH